MATKATILRWRRKYQKLRDATLAYLGNKCAHCGLSDARVLQVDHVFGGGWREHKTIGSHQIFRRVLSGSHDEEYQLLCANCNWIKRAERGETSPRKV